MTLLLALLGCTESPPATPDAPALQELRLALNWFPEPEFGGFYEGVLSGIYEEAGFKVEIIPGGPGAPTLELLGTGRADVAISAADDLLIKRSKGIRAVGVWPAFQHSPQGVMVHAEGGPARFEDISGGQLAIEIGSPFQSFLWDKYGWEGKVEPVPYGGGIGPFLADAQAMQQAYITSEPCMAKAKGAEVNFLPASASGWDPYGTLVAVADPPPPWVKDFVAATQAAWEAYGASPERANARIAELNDQLNPSLTACITEAQGPFLTGEDGLGAMTEARWSGTAASLVKLGLLPEGSTAEGAWSSFSAP